MAKQPKKRAPKPSKRDRNNGANKAEKQGNARFAVADLMRKSAQAASDNHTGQRAG